MRSRGIFPFGVRFGYSKHSTTQTRPFSSMVNAIGLTTCGSPAKSLTSNSVGTLILRDRLLGLEVRLAGRLAVVEAELLLGEGGRGDGGEGERSEAKRHA